MDSIVNGINNLIDWLSGLPAWIFQLFKDFLSSLFYMLIDAFCFMLDHLLLGIKALLDLIPIPAGLSNANQYLVGAPAEFISMMVAVRVPEALAIVVAALGIRFLLGLIPVVRVGG